MKVSRKTNVQVVKEQPKRVVPATKAKKNRNSRLSFKNILESKIGGNKNE